MTRSNTMSHHWSHLVSILLFRYGDIVQEDFVDSYRNLTHKAIMALRWVSQNCQNAKLILKADDDIFINIFKLVGHNSFVLTFHNLWCWMLWIRVLLELVWLDFFKMSSRTLRDPIVRLYFLTEIFFGSILRAKIASKNKIGIRFGAFRLFTHSVNSRQNNSIRISRLRVGFESRPFELKWSNNKLLERGVMIVILEFQRATLHLFWCQLIYFQCFA